MTGSIQAEAYAAYSNIRVDSSRTEQDEVAAWNGIGSWSDYSVQVDSTARPLWGSSKVTLHLEPGIHSLRIENRKGIFSVNFIRML